jgi:hypothetical protein
MNWERVEAVRWWARSLLVIASIVIVAPVFLWITAPAFTHDAPGPTIAGVPIEVYGYAGMLFGMAWMWRIYRAPTKAETARWRYRDR